MEGRELHRGMRRKEEEGKKRINNLLVDENVNWWKITLECYQWMMNELLIDQMIGGESYRRGNHSCLVQTGWVIDILKNTEYVGSR